MHTLGQAAVTLLQPRILLRTESFSSLCSFLPAVCGCDNASTSPAQSSLWRSWVQSVPTHPKPKLCSWVFQWALGAVSARSDGNHQSCSFCSFLLLYYSPLHHTMICRFAVCPGGLCLAALQVNEILHIDSFPLGAAEVCNRRAWIYPEAGGSQRSVSSTLALLAAPSA